MVDSRASTGLAPTVDKACGETFVRAAERALADGNLDAIPQDEIARVMTAAVRLYAAKVDADAAAAPPVEPDKLTPTDVVVTVSAIIKAVGLNLWDLSMWFQRPRG